jgi:hypothetical protein
MIPEISRRKLGWIVALYRGENGVWPDAAFELASFACAQGLAMDWSHFHTVQFEYESEEKLRMEYVLSPGADGWAESGSATLLVKEHPDGLLWKTRWAWGPKRRVEVLSFCECARSYRTAV